MNIGRDRLPPRPFGPWRFWQCGNHLRAAVLIFPPAFTMLLLFILPMAVMALFSFRMGTFGVACQVFTFQHYAEFLANYPFQILLGRSTWIAFETSLFSVLLAYPVAYYLAFHAGERRLTLLAVLLVPAFTSYLLRILAWKLMLSSGGLINTALLALGLIQESRPFCCTHRRL